MLQPSYGDHQIGPLKKLHQLVEDHPLIVEGARLKVFIHYALASMMA
ncbi:MULTISPECIES: hypothetical protein [Bradyrhizobium]|nr:MULTISPECIES: hypothetical protein [Bradyrhizobium]